MKKLILFLQLLAMFAASTAASCAVELKYAVHTSSHDIEFKKQKALKWYDNNVTGGKFYFIKPEQELSSTKQKALRWHARNSE